jgi:hypothetical protein
MFLKALPTRQLQRTFPIRGLAECPSYDPGQKIKLGSTQQNAEA